LNKWKHIILPILIGGLIYLFLHKPNLILHQYLHVPNYYAFGKGNFYFHLVLNYIPDFLWAYALSVFLFSFMPTNKKASNYIVVLTVLFTSELIQLYYPQNFTFDFLDIIIYFVATSLAYVLSYDYKNFKL
jgi:hypothetical protein